MTALPSHLPVFSFFGGSLFFSGGLFCPVAVSSSSRQQTFFFLRRFSFPLRRPFSFRCCFLLFPLANFLFLRRFSFSLCSLSCPATVFLGVFQGRGAAFRPPLFRGLKYCKRPDKKGGRRCMRKPPVKFPWRPESVRVAVVPADPPKSDRSRKCALSTAVTGRRTVKTSCLRESAASGRTEV